MCGYIRSNIWKLPPTKIHFFYFWKCFSFFKLIYLSLDFSNNSKRMFLEIVWNARIWCLHVSCYTAYIFKMSIHTWLINSFIKKNRKTIKIKWVTILKVIFYILLKHPKNILKVQNSGPKFKFQYLWKNEIF